MPKKIVVTDPAEIRIRAMLEEHGMTHAQFGARFGVPIDTIDSWCRGQRTPPAYIIDMIDELIRIDYDVRNRKRRS